MNSCCGPGPGHGCHFDGQEPPGGPDEVGRAYILRYQAPTYELNSVAKLIRDEIKKPERTIPYTGPPIPKGWMNRGIRKLIPGLKKSDCVHEELGVGMWF